MNRRQFVKLGLGGLVSLCGSGCDSLGGFGGVSDMWKPSYTNENIPKTELHDCRYKSNLLKRAEILSKSNYTSNKIEAAVLYGEFCELEKMDAILEEIMNDDGESNKIAFRCAEIGEKYHKFHKMHEAEEKAKTLTPVAEK